jgi:hypothetical protein
VILDCTRQNQTKNKKLALVDTRVLTSRDDPWSRDLSHWPVNVGNPEVDRRDADFTGVIYGGSSEPKGLRLHRRMPRTTVALYLYEETHKLLEGQFRIELFFGLMCVQIF